MLKNVATNEGALRTEFTTLLFMQTYYLKCKKSCKKKEAFRTNLKNNLLLVKAHYFFTCKITKRTLQNDLKMVGGRGEFRTEFTI